MATEKSEGVDDRITSQEHVKSYMEDISPECQNLISTLPTNLLWARAWVDARGRVPRLNRSRRSRCAGDDSSVAHAFAGDEISDDGSRHPR